MREIDSRLKELSSRLRLTYLRDHLDEMVSTATESKMTPRETLDFILTKEASQRDYNRSRLWLMGAHFPMSPPKELKDFDLSFQPSIDPGAFRELEKLEWVESGENVVLIGPPGVGKTHIAVGLGVAAIRLGITTRFYTAAELIGILAKAKKDQCFEEKLKEINKVKLLIIDELGYLPYGPDEAHLLFQLVNRRYEKKSLVITSNRPPGEWGVIFGDPVAAQAILDRLLHHCIPLLIQGESWRLHEQAMRKAKQ
jgi:DNA replication protein DnaC